MYALDGREASHGEDSKGPQEHPNSSAKAFAPSVHP